MSTTWNPSDKGASITLSGGNLSAAGNTSWNTVRATTSKAEGKWYWESKVTAVDDQVVGFADGTAGTLSTFCGSLGVSCGLVRTGATVVSGMTNVNAGGAFTTNDYVNLAIDFDAGKIWIGKNGTYFASGNPAAGTNPWVTFTPNTTLFPAWSGNTAAATETANFGATAFNNTKPTGFSSWNNYILNAASGSFALTGSAITMKRGLHLLAATGAFTLTGHAAQLIKGFVLTCATGSFSVSGATIAIIHSVSAASKLALRRTAAVLQQIRVNPPTLGQ